MTWQCIQSHTMETLASEMDEISLCSEFIRFTGTRQIYTALFSKTHFYGSGGTSSPACQVMNDQSQLFIATDSNLHILDFDADWAELKDYTNIFVYEMIEKINS